MTISKLHYISQEINGKPHPQMIEEACGAGVQWVQLRMKNKSYEEALAIAKETKKICQMYGTRLIINDHVVIAKEISADGVHLGKTDMDPGKAREFLGPDFIIGGTANTMEDIRLLTQAKVDYIGLGPFRFTKTKENLSPVLGLEGYKKLIQGCADEKINIPVIAIGGILPEDVWPLLSAGLYGVAVSSFINKASDKTKAVASLEEGILEFYNLLT